MDPEKTILLVEDNSDDEVLALRALRRHKICNRVEIARDGAEALDYLLATDDKGEFVRPLPQVVLLDLKLPKIDGLGVLQRLRSHERTRLLPVVVLTSSNEEQDLIKGYQNGANSFVRKPVDFEQFSESVRQLGLYWLVLNQGPPSAQG